MEYENDFIMRQVRDMVRILQKFFLEKIQQLMNTMKNIYMRILLMMEMGRRIRQKAIGKEQNFWLQTDYIRN